MAEENKCKYSSNKNKSPGLVSGIFDVISFITTGIFILLVLGYFITKCSN
ncbi:MAG: hypothetical protein ACRCUS_01225 [Anaerovoracaceae bacterium]